MEDLEDVCRRLTQLYQELTECPVCFDSMDASLKQCINGHGVCSSCALRLDKCPSCQLGLVVRKNVLLGRLLENFPKPCPNFAKGCKTVFSNQDHESFCEFRTSMCLKKGCFWEGSVKYIPSHVKTCTKGSDLLELPCSNSESKGAYTIHNTESKFVTVTPIIFRDQLFWKYCYRDGATKRFSYAFHHVAKSKPSVSYCFIISFKHNGVTFFTHCCKATTDFDGSVDKVNKTGFIIPNQELERFRQPKTSKYVYHLKVITENIG